MLRDSAYYSEWSKVCKEQDAFKLTIALQKKVTSKMSSYAKEVIN